MGVAPTQGSCTRLDVVVVPLLGSSDIGSLCVCKCKNGKGFPNHNCEWICIYMYNNYNKSNIIHKFIQKVIMMMDSLN